jgi:hypothetical protein
VSEHERPDRLDPEHRPSVEDIRALTGPATPHFALQIRARVERLIARLPDGDPARAAGELEAERLAELAMHTGEPRGPGPGSSH